MNDGNHDIDKLLQANVEGQLERFDWDRLGDDVSKRLAAVGLRPRSRPKYLGPLAVAAGLVLAAGVLVVVIGRLQESEPVPSSSPGRATVSIQETADGAGSATVMPAADRVVRCEVMLLDSDRPPADRQAQASWCIVARPASSQVESARRGQTNILCLF
ncbi:MAG: hypothetical protein JW993_04455 [Sedimentisphaerales bacterium]|nr:hypothetical protein [Sedimentisphaerales bacterium]